MQLIDWETLRGIIQKIVGPGVAVIVSGEPEPFFRGGIIVRMTAGAITELGAGDETVSTYNVGTGLLDVEARGQRVFTWSIQVNCDQTYGDSAAVAEKIRSHLFWSYYRRLLRAADMAMVEVLSNTYIDAVWDNREINSSNLDVSLSFAYNEVVDPDLADNQWIEDVEPLEYEPPT